MNLPRPLSTACVALVLLHPLSTLACTTEEATAKAEQLAAKVAEITQQDPQRAAQLREELKDIGPKTSSKELQDECLTYDQRLRELEAVEQEVDAQSATDR